MELLTLAEVAAAVIVSALALPLIVLFGRRRWLARHRATFDCGLRVDAATPGARWVLGVARYSGEHLEWFRAFSLSLRPSYRFERRDTRTLGSRVPDAAEAILLYDGEQVLALETLGGERWELAMRSDVLTGLLSWLEAAPPGLGSSGSTDPGQPGGR